LLCQEEKKFDILCILRIVLDDFMLLKNILLPSIVMVVAK